MNCRLFEMARGSRRVVPAARSGTETAGRWFYGGTPAFPIVEAFPWQAAMNQPLHQLLQLTLQGFTWMVRTIEALWVWSWAPIAPAFSMSWANLPGWKLAVGLIFIAVLAALLIMMLLRSLYAFRRIAAAFWMMAVTVFGVLVFVVVAALFSRGFPWVVASVPDNF